MSANHPQSTWTDERRQLAFDMWVAGASAGVIARKLGGITRQSVIGIVWRAGLRRSPAAIRATLRYGDQSTKRAERAKAHLTMKPFPLPKLRNPLLAQNPVPFWQVPARCCRYAIDDPGRGNMQNMIVCANPITSDDPKAWLCRGHFAIVYNPVPTKRCGA